MPGSKLSEFDRVVLQKAIADGVLEKVDAERILNEVNGEGQVVGCSDGDVRADTADHLHRKGLHRRHEVLGAGGPLPLGPGSPAASLNSLLPGFLIHATRKKPKTNFFLRIIRPLLTVIGHFVRVDLLLLVQLWLGIELKKMSTIVLIAHVPCGIARYYNLNVVEQWKLVTGAKKRLKSLFSDNIVMLLIHVDWGCGVMNTYRFSREKILRWIDENENFFAEIKSRPAEQSAQIPLQLNR